MTDKTYIDLLQETIEDLKTNPEACTLGGGETLSDGFASISYSSPGEKLCNFFNYLIDNDLTDQNYITHNKELRGKKIDEMNVDNIYSMITGITRGERFNSGLIYSCFKDGTLLKLIERLYDLVK